MSSRSLLTVVLLVLSPATLGSGFEPETRILRTGIFHGTEVDAQSGADWFGLFSTDEGFRLEPTAIRVSAVHDPVLDEDPTDASGKEVQIDGEAEPLVLLRGGPWSDRVVPSVAFEWKWDAPAEKLQLEFGGQEYELFPTWTGNGKPHGAEALTDFRLSLQRDGQSQDLVAPDWCCDEAFPHLLWAGDLDGDGALDLLLEASHHYNVSTYVLFLSTAAKSDNLVGKVAEFTTTGC